MRRFCQRQVNTLRFGCQKTMQSSFCPVKFVGFRLIFGVMFRPKKYEHMACKCPEILKRLAYTRHCPLQIFYPLVSFEYALTDECARSGGRLVCSVILPFYPDCALSRKVYMFRVCTRLFIHFHRNHRGNDFALFLICHWVYLYVYHLFL